MKEKELVVENAWFDLPKETDRKFEDVFWDEVGEWLPKITKRPTEAIVYNQNSDKRTLKACWWFWTYHIYNWNQINERKNNWMVFNQEDPKNYWFRFQQSRWRKNTWSSIQEHLAYMKNVERSIDGHVICATEDQMKRAIDMWSRILTWSNKCDRYKTGINKKFTYKALWEAHIFAIVDYDDSRGWFIAENSFGEWRWDKWYFLIPYGYKKYLYSCNAIIDADSTGMLQAYKYELEFKEAIELGITNGTNPDQPATRKEVAVMVLRWLKKALQK